MLRGALTVLLLDAVFPELHFSGHTVGIIGHPVESELLVAAGFKDRLQMRVPSEDMPVGMNELQTDEGRAGSRPSAGRYGCSRFSA